MAYVCLFDDAGAGFDVGTFDTGTVSVTVSESCIMSDVAASVIHCPVLDTLAFSEGINTKLTGTVLDTLPVSDTAFPGLAFTVPDSFDMVDDQELVISGFDLGVFDTVVFDLASTLQSTFTKLIADQVDEIEITDAEGVTAIAANIAETLDMLEIERTKLFMPAIIEDAVLSDVAASVIHCPVISESLSITDDVPLLWTGFDAGLFDTVEFDAESTTQSTFTTLIATQPDSVAIADVEGVTKIISYPVDSLAHSESINTKLSGFTVLDTLALRDETVEGFDAGLFDAATFDSLGMPSAWTKLIMTILDTMSTSENFYTLWRQRIYDTLAFSETDTDKITSTVPESLDILESVATTIYPPTQPDTLAFSDIGSSVLICTVTDSATFSDSETFTIFANIPESLTFLEELSTKIQVSETDTIVLTDIVQGEIRLLLDSWIVDSITLISKMR